MAQRAPSSPVARAYKFPKPLHFARLRGRRSALLTRWSRVRVPGGPPGNSRGYRNPTTGRSRRQPNQGPHRAVRGRRIPRTTVDPDPLAVDGLPSTPSDSGPPLLQGCRDITRLLHSSPAPGPSPSLDCPRLSPQTDERIEVRGSDRARRPSSGSSTWKSTGSLGASRIASPPPPIAGEPS